MEENNKLVEVKKESIFAKISNFFKNMFKGKESYTIVKEENIDDEVESKNEFAESIKEHNNKEADIIVLKNLYHEGKIDVKELTDDQLTKICELYDEQIFRLKEKNERRKAKLLEYRNTKMKKA